jgi:hypothetical protein
MPAQAAWRKGQTVRFKNNRGRTSNAEVVGIQSGAAAAAPGLGTATTGGTLAAATYTYAAAAVVDGVERPVSATAQQVTTGSTSTVTITAATVTGATAYKFYGRVGGSLGLLVQQASNVYVDTGAASVGAAPTGAAGDARIWIPHEKRYLQAAMGSAANTYSYR